MNPNRTSLLAALLVATLTGCINLPDIDSPSEPRPPETEDPKPLPDLSVRLLEPTGTAYTNGSVDVSIEVTGGAAEAVDLFAGAELLTTLTAPYTFRWDTAAKLEGSYTLMAKARRGTQTFTSDTRTVVVDRTPPQVVGRTPEPGSTDVAARQPIYLFLSEPLAPDSVSNTSVRMTANGNVVDVNASLSADGKILQITPVPKFALPASVNLVPTTQLRDFAGNPLLDLLNIWSWHVPDFYFLGSGLTTPGKITAFPSMKMDASGHPIVAYEVMTDGYVSRWTGNEWVAIGGALNVISGSRLDNPSLQLDKLGRPVVAWSEVTSNSFDIYVRRWGGSAWETIGGALSAVAGDTMAAFPSLQIDAAGNPVVAWIEQDGTAWNIHVWRWDGVTWMPMGGAISAKPGSTNAQLASLRLDGMSNVVVSWIEAGDDSRQAAYVARWSNGSWSVLGGPLSINPGSTDVRSVYLALDLTGQPVVAVQENDGVSNAPFYVLRWTGTEWSSLGGALDADGFPYEGSIQIDGQNRPVVALVQGNPTFKVHLKRWAGMQWEPLGSALEALPGNSSAYSPVLQLNAQGVPFIAWSEADQGNGGIFVARFND